MARVFLSYAREDLALAEASVGWIQAQGHDVFYDADLVVGDQWQERLLERLRWADAMVCLVTTAYVASTWCSAEVGIAIARGSRVMPVLVEAGLKHPLLAGIQSADYARDRGAAFRFVLVALSRIDSGGGGAWPGSPFPGLVPFDTDMSRVFFGRRREISSLTELLRSPSTRAESGMVVVTGPSGCGKSSLVRAGLLPVMQEEPGWWTLPPILPGIDPIGVLARELTGQARRLGLGWQLPMVRSGLDRGSVTGLVDELLLASSEGTHSRRRMLIVIDQLEEVLTLTSDAERDRFAGVLREATRGSVTLV
ncbi:MAG TPA: toll/interleukin-1 receptor domain-containing protein, partial [Nakamurella sp.]